MNDKPKSDGPSGGPGTPPPGERIAKVIARAGVASRREAERMIEIGQVTVNGEVITRAALNVTDADRITVNGTPLNAPEPARLWLYHKPTGLVTTTRDEKGRTTIFDELPDDLPRVMSVGRLDLNSEGLLLLTNDGAVKRRLELPSTGWLRRYRVRVNGRPSENTLEPLRKGITVDGESFQPMIVTLDRQQGANAWITIGLREGKNREIRRALGDLGLNVNRLIRISYGPFQLGQLKPGEVQEIRPRILRDQLGVDAPTEPPAPEDPGKRRVRPRGKAGGDPAAYQGTGKPGAGKPGGGAPKAAQKGNRAAKPGNRQGAKPAGKTGSTPDSNRRPGSGPKPGGKSRPTDGRPSPQRRRGR